MSASVQPPNVFSRIFKGVGIIFAVLIVLFAAAFFILPLPGDVPVLMYHFIRNPSPDEHSSNVVTPENFANEMEFLNRFGYHVISLDDFYAIRTGKRKPRGREVAITFDDGNYTFETTAYPILAKYAFPVTLFVVSESVKNQLHGSMGIESIKNLLTTGWIHLGAHSMTHPFLTKLDPIELRHELSQSKEDLEKIFGVPVKDLAYPYGDFDFQVMRATSAAGYRQAFTTSPKKRGDIPEDLYSQTRVKIAGKSSNLFVFWVKVSGIYNTWKNWRQDEKAKNEEA